jgi:D-glycero-D-manno-heptose 1,7-bisphosphate phosphatase
MPSAVFLDRDGVLIENRSDYVKSWEEVEFLEGALEAMRRLAAVDAPIVMITNQSAVGRGLLAHTDAIALNDRIIEVVTAHGGRIDRTYMCPHHPQENCDCRKPAPGMVLQAARELHLDLSQSFLVGDAITDMEAAHAVGAQGILVLTGRGRAQAEGLQGQEKSFLILPDLAAAVATILAKESKQA